MRCLLILAAFSLFSAGFAQVVPSMKISNPPLPVRSDRVLDAHMVLQDCSVKITTDGFTATTVMVLEFYNPFKYSEMEGVYRFELTGEQVITGFQLELNGKFRDGSIEERWKASNAYNRIVGKRVDPSLLTKEYNNNYCLRIYPIAPLQTRRVRITISQLLNTKNKMQEYRLPMNCSDSTKHFSLSVISLNQQLLPMFKGDFLNLGNFSAVENGFAATADKYGVVLNKLISFVLPLNDSKTFCTKQSGNQTFFALRYHPLEDSVYDIHPSSLHVFWDVSSSAQYRDIKKEISFLKQYIAWHHIKKLSIIPFSYSVKDTAVFDLTQKKKSSWESYLESQEYAGATRLGVLDFSTVRSDVVFLFSDGKNSFGNKLPVKGSKLIYAVNTAYNADTVYLNNLVGAGGRIIRLNTLTISNAIQLASVAENKLAAVVSSTGRTIIEQQFPIRLEDELVFNGTMNTDTDTLTFIYGNNQLISSTEKMVIRKENNCSTSSIDRMDMLWYYPKNEWRYYWSDMIDYALKERIVTMYTAYIVLERIEDYIRYNIDVPKDLEEESLRLGYKKVDTRESRKRLMLNSKESILTNLLNEYNKRISLWDKNEAPLKYIPYEKPVVNNNDNSGMGEVGNTNNSTPPEQQLSGKLAGISISSTNRLDEVVVVGYGSMTKRSLTYSVAYINQRDLLAGYRTVEDAMVGKVAGMQVTGTGQPGTAATISIRGAASINASNQPLFIVNGVPVEGNINDVINVNDIESITILKDAAATAIYGSRASSGAIVITSKRGKYNPYYYNYSRRYKLSKMEDVEYMQQIKSVPAEEKWSKYEELEMLYAGERGFYFDMAQHFYETGFKQKAKDILMEAAEQGDGSFFAQRTIGFFLESWKQFDAAAEIYASLLVQFPGQLALHRDLAWAYFQSGKYQQAVDVLYSGIVKDFGADEKRYLRVKGIMLNEMNAMIAIHRTQLDLSEINPSLLKSLPCDLRISAEDNFDSNINMEVQEPDNAICSYQQSPTKKGGYILNPNDWYYYNVGVNEYQLRHAVNGKYKLRANYYSGGYWANNVPSVMRVCVFRNFGQPNQSIEVENIMMDNQYGEVEIKEVKW